VVRTPEGLTISGGQRKSEMAELTLTEEQMLDLVAQHRDALVGKITFSDILMPNGETLENCAEDYIWQVGIAMSEYACSVLATDHMPVITGNEIDKMLFDAN
jgi:hypothetical protein